MDKNKTQTLLVIALLAAVLIAGTMLYGHFSGNSGSNENNNNDMGEAPDFEMQDYGGSPVRLSDHFGKPIVINFWATWCGYCVNEMPLIEEKIAGEKDIDLIMLDVTDGMRETTMQAKKFIQEGSYTFDVYFDYKQEAVGTYSVTSFPTTIGISKEGNIVYKKIGALSDTDIDELLSAVRA